jgi:hypothetical protein
MVFEGAPLPTRVRFRSAAAAAAKPLPEFFHKRETDTETSCNRRLRGVSGLQSMNNAITEVLRVGFRISHYALNGPYIQLQTALGAHGAAPDHT